MRLAAEIPHKKYKISIFSMNNRLNLKFEYDGLEQGYRYFLGNGIDGPTDVIKMVDEAFLSSVDRTFGILQKTRYDNLPHSSDDGFEEII